MFWGRHGLVGFGVLIIVFSDLVGFVGICSILILKRKNLVFSQIYHLALIN